ncbi:MAG: hypothetical protein IIZ94_13250 [Prevotella sp.]|nr:hypothetical protein [Prevotella sp.]
MSDLIKRADAMGAVQDHFNANGFKGYDDGQKMMDRIKALPSADAVPIVYCMDCAKSVPLDEHGALWKCKAHDRTTLRHSYCNNGERKGGDSE